MLVCVAAAWLVPMSLSSDSWVQGMPQGGPVSYGAGSDMDERLHIASLVEAYQVRGRVAHWDPFIGFGQPRIADPENFSRHPGFRLGVSLGGYPEGLSLMAGVQYFLLGLGLMWLAWQLKLPTILGLAGLPLLLQSWEWSARLEAGHFFYLGFCSLPLVAAATLQALEEDKERWARRLLWGAVAGVALGFALLCGGHYPVPMGGALIALLCLAHPLKSKKQSRVLLGMLGLMSLPLFVREGPLLGRWPLEILGFGLVFWGLRSGRALRRQAQVGLGVAVGIMAATGPSLCSMILASPGLGRLGGPQLAPMEGPPVEPTFNQAALEGWLALPGPLWWVLVALGLLFIASRKPSIAFAVAAMTLMGWSVNLPWSPTCSTRPSQARLPSQSPSATRPSS